MTGNRQAVLHRYNTSEKNRANQRRYKYGLQAGQYEQLLAAQDNACAICRSGFVPGRSLQRPCVDHDHQTGKIRGLLCAACNAALGLLGDNAVGIRRALEYLTRE